MSSLAQSRILLIVSGGIAAYKSPECVRRLRDAGAAVKVVMTAAAQNFVGALSLQATSGEPVHVDLFDPAAEAAMGHIELARWADVVLVAPASADFLAKIAHGLADDLATTLCLATRAPLLVAPAMNQQMWANRATQTNLATLTARGVTTIDPDSGAQACGESGPGRMVDAAVIVAACEQALGCGRLNGLRLMVTAGPTQEPLDPVRMITNRSTGKMGYAVAAAARAAGARVTVVSGPSAVTVPAGCEVVRVNTAAEMYAAVMDAIAAQDIFIATAAVADYTTTPAAEKLKKSDTGLTLTLAATRDILREVAARPRPPFTVGFAAETSDVLAHARQKLNHKALDMIAANRVGVTGSGFESNDNELFVLWQGGECHIRSGPKEDVARQLIDVVATRYFAVR